MWWHLNFCFNRNTFYLFFASELKHLAIEGIHDMPWLTDLVFWEVFRHMELKSLKLTGDNPNRPLEVSISAVIHIGYRDYVEGIKIWNLNFIVDFVKTGLCGGYQGASDWQVCRVH